MKKITFQIFIVFLCLNLHAFDINCDIPKTSILDKSEVFLDLTNTLTFEEVVKKQFQKNNEEVINLGIVPSTALWAKFTLKNTSDQTITKIIEYANSEAEDIRFYDQDKVVVDGMFHHHLNRDSFNPIFTIRLKPYEERTFYIQSHCKISTFVMKLTLWNEKDFLTYNNAHKFAILLFFTIITTLLLYNLMLLVFTKDIVYFYYVFYLSGVIFFESLYLGVAQLYILSNAATVFLTQATMGYIVILVTPMILFTMEFLHTKRFPRLHKFLKLYLYGLPVLALLSFDNFLFDLNVLPIFFPLGVLMVLSGVYAYFHGTKEASVYLLGWTFVILSLILSVVQSIGGYNIFEQFRYTNEVAFALEAFIFSIALAYRIKQLNIQLIELQKNEQEKLQQLVNQQTQDIQNALEEKEILYKELQHRVKNNLAMVISLLQFQIHQSQEPTTKHELKITCNRINSFAKLYELLHLSNNNYTLSTQLYFENIVKYIKIHFTKDVKIIYNIEKDIPLNDLIYCGLILNELVTNSFKYAFERKGVITVKTYKDGEYLFMSVEDDGRGFDQETTPSSLGFTIVKTLSTKQLRAEIDIDTNHGTKTTIKWKI